MAERQLKITRVANDTRISRTTLTALSQEQSKGVQLDTLNTLCNYFNITPCEFFDYIPYEFSINVVNSDDETSLEIPVDFIEKNINYDLFINVYNNRGLKIKIYSLHSVLSLQNIIVDDWNDETNMFQNEMKTSATFRIYNKSDDDETFLEFLNNNFSVQWRKYILDYLENKITYYLAQDFYEIKIVNELKELI